MSGHAKSKISLSRGNCGNESSVGFRLRRLCFLFPSLVPMWRFKRYGPPHFFIFPDRPVQLEGLFRQLKDTPWGKHCSAMQGIVFECNGMTRANYCQSVRDAGLMAGARRIEHYETAAYGTARAFALLLQDRQSAEQLRRALKVPSIELTLLL